MSEVGAVPGQPPFRGIALAVRSRPPRREKLAAGAGPACGPVRPCWHPGRRGRFGAAIGAPPCRTLLAFDLARTEVLAPIERDRHPPVKTLERCQWPRCLDRLHEQSVECRRRSAVQHQADVVVGGDRRHAEQRLAVRPTVPLRQRLLMPKERRASHEEDRKRRQTNVRYCVVAVAPRASALVVQTGADFARRPDHVCNGAHPRP